MPAPVDVWPECWPAVHLFIRLGTQWRVGMSGPTGLDYSVMFRMLDRLGLSADEYDDWESDLRLMEAEALDTMRDERDKRAAK